MDFKACEDEKTADMRTFDSGVTSILSSHLFIK